MEIDIRWKHSARNSTEKGVSGTLFRRKKIIKFFVKLPAETETIVFL